MTNTNIEALRKETAPERSRGLLDAVEKQMGSVPNIFLTFAHSPAVLDGYLQFSGSLAKGRLSKKLREQIAVATAGNNQCDYCASAHTFLGKKVGVDEKELSRNLHGESDDPKTKAVLTFVAQVVSLRGQIKPSDLQPLREIGFSEEEIVEIIGHIGLNIFTNYFNHIAGTENDFPAVSTKAACAR